MAMNAACDPILDMRLSQQQLKEMFERNKDLAKANRFIQDSAMRPRNSELSPAGPGGRPFSAGANKPSKYRNVKVEFEGMKFDSKKELRCWQELKLREKAGEIRELQRQVVFSLDVNGKHIGRFTADFTWRDVSTLLPVVADCKSPATRKEAAYSLRKRIFEAQYAPLVIREL